MLRVDPGQRAAMRMRGLAGWFAMILLASLGGPARAAEEDKAQARAHYESANRYYDVHDYARALEEYKAAYIAKPDPAFLFNMGQCYKKLGRPGDALEFYRDYLKKAPRDDPNRGAIEAKVRELESGEVRDPGAATRPPPPTGATPPASVTPAGAMAPSSAPGAIPPGAPPALPTSAGLDLTAPARTDRAAAPFYATWWFWTGAGVAVAAGVVTAVLLTTGGSKTNTSNAPLGTRGVFQ